MASSVQSLVSKTINFSKHFYKLSCFILSRNSTSDATTIKRSEFMQKHYQLRKKRIFDEYKQLSVINPRSIFAVNQLNLNDINVYGFDYDYTLAQYAVDMQDYIYKEALNILVEKHHFPKTLRALSYQPNFCIRGLHYDISKSLLMKVDICNVIQLGTVHRGMQKLTDEEVHKVFDGSRHIPKHVIDQSYTGGESLKQLMDIFSMPEMMLLANVVDYFDKKNIPFDPRILFENVQNAVREVHVSGLLYDEVCRNVEMYLEKHSLCKLIDHLLSAQKKLFLITNSNFHFVNTGMRYLLGSDWQDAFDVVIVEAKKPHFFKTKSRPFKTLVPDTPKVEISWSRVSNFKKGSVYCEGCLYELMKLSQWEGTEVLYFGDQIYADLSDLTYAHGWRTGAIIPELESEIEVMNSIQFGKSVLWIQTLEHLLESMQVFRDAESKQLIKEWVEERQNLKIDVKDIFNPHFGSVFRANLSPSFFAGRLCRMADLYTSSVNNLNQYSTDHFFFPSRGTLPHETVVYHPDHDHIALEKTILEYQA